MLLDSGFDDGSEGGRFVDCELGKDLAIKGNASSLEASDQFAVGGSVEASTSVDARVPQLSECSLPVLSVAGSKLQTLRDGLAATFDTNPVWVAKAFGGFADFVVPRSGGNASFNSHVLYS